MAKGEARYSSAGKTVVRFDNKPLPTGMYQLALKEDGLEVKKSDAAGPDAIPYVNCRLEALSTASREGGKNRLVFHKWFLSMKPGSDGIIMPERGGGIVEFCRSYGEEADFGLIEQKQSDGSTVSYFNPEEVLEYLQGKVDEPRSAKVIIEPVKDSSGKVDKNANGNNKVGYWELDAAVMTGETENEEKPAPAKGKALPKKK